MFTVKEKEGVPVFILLMDFIFGVFLNVEDKLRNIKSLVYNKIKSKVISTVGEDHQLERLVIEFSFPPVNKIGETTEKLLYQLLNTPWIAVLKAPAIENISPETDRLIIREWHH